MKDKDIEQLLKDHQYQQDLEQLKTTKPTMVSDFQKPVTKTFQVDKTIPSNIQPIKSGADFQADQLIRKAERSAREEALGKVGGTLDYSAFKNFKPGAKKLLGAVPVLGGLASALSSGDASAAVPVLGDAETTGPQAGSLDDRLERGTLTDADKQQMAMEQARVRALQGMK